jgi:hypothetical protein
MRLEMIMAEDVATGFGAGAEKLKAGATQKNLAIFWGWKENAGNARGRIFFPLFGSFVTFCA